MTSAGKTATSNQFLAEYEIFPPVQEERFHTKLVEIYQDIALRVNEREIAVYDKVEINTGQRFFGTTASATKRLSFRKVFDITTSIAAGATFSTAHNITNVQFFTNIYGTIQTSIPDDRPLPYTSATLITDQVQLYINSGNIVIVNGSTAPQIDQAIVVLEYIKT